MSSSTVTGQEPRRLLLIGRDGWTKANELARSLGDDVVVDRAHDLGRAVETLRGELPDVVLLDISLAEDPISDFARIRVEVSEIPIVVVGTPEQEVLLLRLVRLGAAEYLLSDQIGPTLARRTLLYAIERKAAERDRKKQEEWYELLFASNPNPMWFYDSETLRFLDVNEMAVRQYGYSREEFLSMTIRDIRLSEEVPRLERILRAGVRNQGQRYRVRHRTKAGRILDVVVVSNALDHRGKKARLVAALDVSDVVEAREARRESEERFRQLAENVRETFWLLEVDARTRDTGTLLYVSPAFEPMTGYRVEGIFDDPFSFLERVVPEDAAELKAAGRRAVAGEEAEVEFRLQRPDGSLRWLRTRVAPVRNVHGQVYRIAGTTEDITDAKQLEEELRHSQRLEAVGRLAGGIAHDFNNILSVVMGNAQLIELERPSPEVRAAAAEVARAAERAADLIRQLLAFSRKQHMQMEVTDLNSLVEEVASMVTRLARADAVIEVRLEPDLALVRADPGQLHQVLVNLVVNALDAMPEGGHLTISTSNTQISEADSVRYPYRVVPGFYVRVRVADTGTGMDEETRSHVFEPFFTTKGGEGSGLGLSTVYGIVKQSGGYVWVESQLNEGTTFDVYLPRFDGGAVVNPERVGATTVEAGRGETLLLVEDDDDVRRVFARNLIAGGYHVLEAENGEEALRIVREHEGPIHLLISDVVMPVMGGADLVDELRTLRPNTRVLYTSGYADPEVLERMARHSGVSTFIPKPIVPTELQARVRAILDTPEE